MRSVLFNGQQRLRNGWRILGYLVLAFLLVAGLFFARGLLPVELRKGVPKPHLAFLGALAASWLCLRFERQSLASLGLVRGWRTGGELGLGLVGGAGLVGLVALAIGLADGYHLVRAAGAGVSVLLGSAWTMLGVAFFEETLFRGYVFQRAVRGMGPLWAQLVFAAVFCLAHLRPDMSGSVMALAMLNTFLGSLMLGLCYLRTGRLALPIGVHMGWNWMMGSLGFGVSGEGAKGWWMPVFHDRPEWLTGGSYGLEASIMSTAVLALAVAALSAMKMRASEAPPARLPGVPVLEQP